LNSSCERTRLCSFGFFHVSCPVTNSGREGRVAFGLLRHGAFVLALPKTRVVKLLSRAHDSLSIRIRPVSPGRRVSPSIYHPRPVRSRGRRENFRSFPHRRVSCNALNLLHLGAPVKGPISRFSSPGPRHRPFRRQPYKVQAPPPVVNP